MDFLKTLLIYMSLTMAGAVQEGPLPQDVPTPTVAPTAIVEMVEETPMTVDVEVTAAPTATPAPTNAEPTITPNTKYFNLKSGDRGDEVKKLQKRLIELGYLPEGSADGAFGNQTRRAVMAFQEANGLTKDGVAGDATQTHLFQNPDVIPAVTATPAPTVTPEPTIVPPAAAAGLTAVENASIILGDRGEVVTGLRTTDGAAQTFLPTVWMTKQGEAALELQEIAQCIDGWELFAGDAGLTLVANGYIVTFAPAENPTAFTVDEKAAEIPAEAVVAGEGKLYITQTFLQTVFSAQTTWDEDENTLLISIPAKAALESAD